MATHRLSESPMRKLLSLRFLVFVGLALLALACAPAAEPQAAQEPAVPAPAEVAAPAPAAPAEAPVAAVVPAAPEGGKYIDRAGLHMFVPKGSEYGAPIIPADAREPRYGGTLTQALAGDPPNIDPYSTTATFSYTPTGHLYDRLVHLPVGGGVDATVQTFVPGLAESWEVDENFMNFTFHLRKGVKFQNLPPVNGREFTSDDVLFTYDLFTSAGSVQKGFFLDVNKVETPDKYTVIYHMKTPSPGFLSVLSQVGRGYILPRGSENINRKITAIGTGPFIAATDYEYKVGIDQRRNPDYWATDQRGNRLPFLDRFLVRIIPDSSARTAAFRTGKIDVGASVGNPTEAKALLRTNPTTLIREGTTPFGTADVGFRLDKAPWSDVRVRRAMSLAVDYEALSQTLYEVPFDGSVMISGAWYGSNNTIATLTKECSCPWYQGPDVKQAKALLAEAGYPNGFTTTYEYFIYSQQHTSNAELLAEYWRQIGVTVQIKSMDYSIWRANLDKGAWPDITGWSFIFPYPSSMYGAVAQVVPGRAGNSNMGWVFDPKLTALVADFDTLYKDASKQTNVLKQIRAYVLDQVYGVPWSAGHSYSAFAPRLRNYTPIISILTAEYRLAVGAWIDNDWAFNQ
ncbi:MAG: ABC transporter substrate-binding protein [Dehalococcoidia bacterium]|nr:ABC transporter substrate-binding protein [Dehalococcoidia bacterium]